MGLTDHLICPLRAAGMRAGIQRGVCHRGKRAHHACDTRLGSLVESQPAFTTAASPKCHNGAKWPSVAQRYHIIMLVDIEEIPFVKIKSDLTIRLTKRSFILNFFSYRRGKKKLNCNTFITSFLLHPPFNVKNSALSLT